METIFARYKVFDLPHVSAGDAARRHLLSDKVLQQMHLMPSAAPVGRGTPLGGG